MYHNLNEMLECDLSNPNRQQEDSLMAGSRANQMLLHAEDDGDSLPDQTIFDDSDQVGEDLWRYEAGEVIYELDCRQSSFDDLDHDQEKDESLQKYSDGGFVRGAHGDLAILGGGGTVSAPEPSSEMLDEPQSPESLLYRGYNSIDEEMIDI